MTMSALIFGLLMKLICGERLDVLILIPSRNDAYIRRCSLRDSWLNLITNPKKFGCEECSKLRIKYLFVLDKYTDYPVDNEIYEENKHFKDMIFLPVQKDKAIYSLLFSKMYAMFKYAIDHYDFNMAFKIDIDTYVHVDRFVNLLLKHINKHDNIYMGSITSHEPVLNYGLWKNPNYLEKIGTNEFIPHSKGPGYGLSKLLIQAMLSNPGPFVLYVGEDTHFGLNLVVFETTSIQLPTSRYAPAKYGDQKTIIEHYHKPHSARAKFISYLLGKSMGEKPQNDVSVNTRICEWNTLFSSMPEYYFFSKEYKSDPRFDSTKFRKMFENLQDSQCRFQVDYVWREHGDCVLCEYTGNGYSLWMNKDGHDLKDLDIVKNKPVSDIFCK